MKRILITGKNSYVGNSFEKWLENYSGEYEIEKVSLRDDSWKNHDFSTYSVVLHVAGIAHVSTDPKMEELYYKINRDLTIEVAKKAKNSGVKQFVFMSSIIVYGEGIKKSKIIDKTTVPKPSNFYGKSKLEAEEGIKLLESNDFKIAIIRPPMIYGKDSKGNYPKLAKAAQKLPIFPDIDNQRSMLHIDNLSEFLRLIVENQENGLFFPQNREFVKTSEMVKCISEVHGNNIKLVKLFNPILNLLSDRVGIFNKVFGNLVYDHYLSEYKSDYHVRSLEESIMHTESNKNDEKKIDILLMSDNGLETVGGEQESTKIIINGLKNKFKVGVVQPGIVKKTVPEVNYYHLTSETRIKHLIKNPILFLKYVLKSRKIIVTQKPSIIHTQAQVSFFIVSLFKKLRLIPREIKLVHTERGLYTKYSSFFKRLFLFFMKELNTLVTTTEFNMNYWMEALFEKGISVHYKVIENTAGQLFETYEEDLEKDKSDVLTIGFAGRYTNWKNWPLAVDISKKLNAQLGSKLHVEMAVGCLDKKSEKDTEGMFNELHRALGRRFNGQINISLEEMNQFYYNIDVFILTSNYNTESFGRTLVEAMSRKTAVLSTNAGGSVEVVGNVNNICDSSSEFATQIMEFYNNNVLLKEEKEKNYNRVKKIYSLNNNISKHKLLYEKLLNTHK